MSRTLTASQEVSRDSTGRAIHYLIKVEWPASVGGTKFYSEAQFSPDPGITVESTEVTELPQCSRGIETGLDDRGNPGGTSFSLKNLKGDKNNIKRRILDNLGTPQGVTVTVFTMLAQSDALDTTDHSTINIYVIDNYAIHADHIEFFLIETIFKTFQKIVGRRLTEEDSETADTHPDQFGRVIPYVWGDVNGINLIPLQHLWGDLGDDETTINGNQSQGTTTLNITDASGWPSSSSGVTRGVVDLTGILKDYSSQARFAWTGKSGNQLTGVTWSGGLNFDNTENYVNGDPVINLAASGNWRFIACYHHIDGTGQGVDAVYRVSNNGHPVALPTADWSLVGLPTQSSQIDGHNWSLIDIEFDTTGTKQDIALEAMQNDGRGGASISGTFTADIDGLGDSGHTLPGEVSSRKVIGTLLGESNSVDTEIDGDFADLTAAQVDSASIDAACNDVAADNDDHRFNRAITTETTVGELVFSAAREAGIHLYIDSGAIFGLADFAASLDDSVRDIARADLYSAMTKESLDPLTPDPLTEDTDVIIGSGRRTGRRRRRGRRGRRGRLPGSFSLRHTHPDLIGNLIRVRHSFDVGITDIVLALERALQNEFIPSRRLEFNNSTSQSFTWGTKTTVINALWIRFQDEADRLGARMVLQYAFERVIISLDLRFDQFDLEIGDVIAITNAEEDLDRAAARVIGVVYPEPHIIQVTAAITKKVVRIWEASGESTSYIQAIQGCHMIEFFILNVLVARLEPDGTFVTKGGFQQTLFAEATVLTPVSSTDGFVEYNGGTDAIQFGLSGDGGTTIHQVAELTSAGIFKVAEMFQEDYPLTEAASPTFTVPTQAIWEFFTSLTPDAVDWTMDGKRTVMRFELRTISAKTEAKFEVRQTRDTL